MTVHVVPMGCRLQRTCNTGCSTKGTGLKDDAKETNIIFSVNGCLREFPLITNDIKT